MNSGLPQLRVELDAGPDADTEELEHLSVGLRDELLELDVDAVVRTPGRSAPAGAKGPVADTAGTLLVAISNSAVAVALVGLLRSWVGRAGGRKVTVSLGEDQLEVTRVSADDQAKLIAAWLDDHARP
jgi:hypothetical protein